MSPTAIKFALALLAACLAALPISAGAQDRLVALELVLLADSSSSIRGPEFDLQIQGYAQAFQSEAVIDAIENLGAGGLAVTFVQWSATFQQVDTVPWRVVRNRDEAVAFGQSIAGQARRFTGFGTAMGSALEHGAALLRDNGLTAPRQVIDITADEHSNQGPHPRSIRDLAVSQGVTINGLAILDDDFELEDYFRRYVTGGPGSFVMAVESYDDFADAIARKILREISDDPLAWIDEAGRQVVFVKE